MTVPDALQFSDADEIGRVASVDTSRVAISVSNATLLTTVGIGNLVAVQGQTEHEYLISVTERVTRNLREELPDLTSDEEGDLSIQVSPVDDLRTVLIGTYRTVDGAKSNTFKRGADSFPQIDRSCFVINGKNLQRFMGILGADVKEDERLKLGTFVVDRAADAIASGDKFFQRHAAILGSTGSGKSWTVALILERAANLAHPNIIVFDMHGEYESLATSAGGFASRFKIAGPGDLSAPPANTIFLPYWLLNRDEMLSMILDRSDQNAPNQASRFTSHVRDLKSTRLAQEGQTDILQTFTVDSPIPYQIKDLLDRLREDDTAKGVGAKGAPVKGEWEGRLTRFVSRLEAKLEDRRYGFMFQPHEDVQQFEWLDSLVTSLLTSSGPSGIKIVDFSEVPADVLPVVTATLARLLYDVQFWMDGTCRTPVTLLCDEAHLYLPVREDADAVEKQALGVFERIAKEGRKYGFSLLVVSQRPSDVSRTILSQCNNFLALRLTNESDQNVVKRLMPDSLAGLTAILPLLDTGEALLLGDAVLLPSRIKLDKPKIPPNSATLDFWTQWGCAEPQADILKAAVKSLRSQTRGKIV
jgi:DNA helicase HerA-like ATPase